MTDVDILRGARALILQRGWHPSEGRRCILYTIEDVFDKHRPRLDPARWNDLAVPALENIAQTSGYTSAVVFNYQPTTTQARVVAIFDAVIIALEAASKPTAEGDPPCPTR